jgi:hypothetical protein
LRETVLRKVIENIEDCKEVLIESAAFWQNIYDFLLIEWNELNEMKWMKWNEWNVWNEMNEYNESNEWNKMWTIFEYQHQDIVKSSWSQLILNDDVILWFNGYLKIFEWIGFVNELKRSRIGNETMSWTWLNEIVIRWLF